MTYVIIPGILIQALLKLQLVQYSKLFSARELVLNDDCERHRCTDETPPLADTSNATYGGDQSAATGRVAGR